MDALPDDLTTLVQTALALEGADRRRAAGRINDWLVIRHGVATEREREEVSMWLDHPRFGELSDDAARHCRAEAAELLMSLGYPGALHVSPEALLAARHDRTTPVLRRSAAGEWIGRVILPLAFVPLLAMSIKIGARRQGCLVGYGFEYVDLAGTLALIRWAATFPSRGIALWHAVGLGALVATAFAGLEAYHYKETEVAALSALGAFGLVAMTVASLVVSLRRR